MAPRVNITPALGTAAAMPADIVGIEIRSVLVGSVQILIACLPFIHPFFGWSGMSLGLHVLLGLKSLASLLKRIWLSIGDPIPALLSLRNWP